jgi:hypothetical protein
VSLPTSLRLFEVARTPAEMARLTPPLTRKSENPKHSRSAEIRNPKHEIRNKFEGPKSK